MLLRINNRTNRINIKLKTSLREVKALIMKSMMRKEKVLWIRTKMVRRVASRRKTCGIRSRVRTNQTMMMAAKKMNYLKG